jgi:hypothetical protein
MSRRNFAMLTAAAAGGLMAVGVPSFAQGEKSKVFVDPGLLLSGDKNVCKGLNTCKGKGKGDHDCAGKGSCATAEAHSCDGHNSCRGQGGCGGYPGQNTCKEKGHCAVPLSEDSWKLAKKQLEHLQKDAKKFAK